ncbi:fumarylacetoacetate hydrolase family protein [Streptomyces sp. NBC_00503]|uniref:fumarylacetoacetate hydrolase family protein n=1 Tax=Streptomyces sp. NBC_00503 TaxID=2903659 RepID=UPI002E811497|nr:fumarylacetoacetate hydrolase family protein [Streptomyces sp. NBC_00503]WUD81499.1 fumarylacetoacetate hydrolase family protein [Streptomyces sp. NBC_00503]
MKLLRVGPVGSERPALLDQDGILRDLSGLITDVDGALLADDSVLSRVREAAAAGDLPVLDAEGLRIGSAVGRIGKVVGIGLNYHGHAAEVGAEAPAEPILFLKASDTVVGPDDTVLIPRESVKTDWEAELGVVIGSTARYLASAEEGLAHVGGYVLVNDVTERAFQTERGGTWDKGKNCETFTPLGPWLVTADEIPDPQVLDVKLWVNGELKQDGHTSDQIFPVGEVVRYVSQFMTLYPGDVLVTGTPAGVAAGQPEPKPFLRAGDVVEVEIEGLGRQRQEFKDA